MADGASRDGDGGGTTAGNVTLAHTVSGYGMGTTAANVEVTVGSPSGANQAVSGATGTWETAQTVTAAIEDPADTAAIRAHGGGIQRGDERADCDGA